MDIILTCYKVLYIHIIYYILRVGYDVDLRPDHITVVGRFIRSLRLIKPIQLVVYDSLLLFSSLLLFRIIFHNISL